MSVSLTPNEEKDVVLLLKSIDSVVVKALPHEIAVDFFTIIVDRSLDQESFELQLAKLFVKHPEGIEASKEAIQSASNLHELMSLDNQKSAGIRNIVFKYFDKRINELLDINIDSFDSDSKGFKQAEQGRIEEQNKLQKEISDLQGQYQRLFDEEAEDRRSRKEEKNQELEEVQRLRQFDFDGAAIERRMRREKLKKMIENLSKILQEQHDNAIRAQKIIRLRKTAKIKIQAARQMEEQNRQANERRAKKEKEKAMMELRQKLVIDRQRKQSEERANLKKNSPTYLRDNLFDT